MSLIGSLEDFSLPEIFLFIEQGKKSGLLTLCALPVSKAKAHIYYFWISQGCLVGAANRLDNRGLLRLLHQSKWVSPRVVTKLAQLCPTHIPLGLHLKNQGVLQTSQLQQLFFAQILQPLSVWFNHHQAQFRFDQKVPLPMREMTGLSVSAELAMEFTCSKDTTVLPVDDWALNLNPATQFRQSTPTDAIEAVSRVKKTPENSLMLILP